MTPFCLLSSILILSSSALFWALPMASATMTTDTHSSAPRQAYCSLEALDNGCIRTDDELAKAIAAVPTSTTTATSPTTIELCPFTVLTVHKPINLSNKAIDLQCGDISMTSRVSCVIDNFLSRHARLFVGNNARLSIRGILIHQDHDEPEPPLSALYDLVDSTVTIQDSAFTYTLPKKDDVVTDRGLHGDAVLISGTLTTNSAEIASLLGSCQQASLGPSWPIEGTCSKATSDTAAAASIDTCRKMEASNMKCLIRPRSEMMNVLPYLPVVRQLF